ncbi:hypothetical protein DFH28DRAFT_1217028 [Melampsora americana]|nr:hypothetical protein DFH28DRAFT_1217028 [Melampsora americana]
MCENTIAAEQAVRIDTEPPDPDNHVVSTPRDDQSEYDDAMDALGTIEWPAPVATTTPPTRQPVALEKVTLPPSSFHGPSSVTPLAPMLRDRKQTRLRIPPIWALAEADELSNTPRSARIAELLPGGSTSSGKPLDVLIQRLLEVTKATLVPKSKTSSIKVNVESAANILLLTGLIKEQASLDEPRRLVFEAGHKTVTDPASALSSAFEFKVSTIVKCVDVLSKHIAKLLADGLPTLAGKKQAPPKNMYALAALKQAHTQTPSSSSPTQTASLAKARACPQARPRPCSEHMITLNQLDPANIAGAEKSIP